MGDQTKISKEFGVVVIALLVVAMVMINSFDQRKLSDQKEYVAVLVNVIHNKNNKIIILAKQLAQKQKDYDDLQKALVDTRNNLEALSKKMPGTNLPPAAATK